MFEETRLGGPGNKISDWVLRGAIALIFVLFGAEKFPSNSAGPWVKLFQEVGIGQWLRSFTGAVEIVGGALVLIPWTSRVGLALLAATMASAAFILDFVIRRLQGSIISSGFFVLLAAFSCARRSH